jgi:2-methylisocitrate lyase-like PEP mutase family enzyme
MPKRAAVIRQNDPARPTWKALLKAHAPLLLPAAHDALTARLIERAGFPAYQVGGFALNGARHGFPDLDLTHYGEESAAVRDIVEASSLPVLIDADDGYGDVKNVTRTIRGYEALGASAIFFEDQLAPKRCGHMSGKAVIEAKDMVAKVRAAAAARRSRETFLIARTDAIAPHGLDEALRRGSLYLEAGADGLFVEGPESVGQLERIGREFKGVPTVANMLEGGGRTPLVPPEQLHAMGFSMILYPTSLIFRVTRTIMKGLEDLKAGRFTPEGEGVGFDEYEEIVGLPAWAELEKRFESK